MKISVVTTLYKSSPYVAEFYKRITSSIHKIGAQYEIIFVDDGSPDDSLSVALELLKNDLNITVVELSRNFGHHKAMMTGLKYANGDYVLMIDSDLEEPPELLEVYWKKMSENKDTDVVYGKLSQRKGTVWGKLTSGLFYRLLNFLSGENMPTDIAFSRLATKNYVSNLLRFEEREMYIGGLWHIAGFNQVPVHITKSSKGITSYTLRKKMEMLVNAITSFSSMPLRMIFHTGIITTVIAIILSIFFFVRKIIYAEVVSGWTSLIVIMLLMSGIILSSLGIIAIYMSKIFNEVKNRPYTIVRSVHKGDCSK
ncbi:MAG: glycosyltransferase family 2 protein [Proteobacteria bacterium]|nr:glycosyltransferase family 2 protein [Pseudomonadota bacterium]MBU1648816.1 glycosyltransferase family 2 protein [Pseudomonadota bacterium]